MKPRTRNRRRSAGRPAPTANVVSREAILSEALVLLEEGGLEAVTMRALARRLSVDAMAPYHYFRDKDAILRAAAALAYSRLEVKVARDADWSQRLESLAIAYLHVLARSGGLLRYLSTRAPEAEGPARLFDAHFRAAVEPLSLSKQLYRIARGAFVDLVHGFSLALRRGAGSPGQRELRAELQVYLAGLEALAARAATPGRTPPTSERRRPKKPALGAERVPSKRWSPPGSDGGRSVTYASGPTELPASSLTPRQRRPRPPA